MKISVVSSLLLAICVSTAHGFSATTKAAPFYSSSARLTTPPPTVPPVPVKQQQRAPPPVVSQKAITAIRPGTEYGYKRSDGRFMSQKQAIFAHDRQPLNPSTIYPVYTGQSFFNGQHRIPNFAKPVPGQDKPRTMSMQAQLYLKDRVPIRP